MYMCMHACMCPWQVCSSYPKECIPCSAYFTPLGFHGKRKRNPPVIHAACFRFQMPVLVKQTFRLAKKPKSSTLHGYLSWICHIHVCLHAYVYIPCVCTYTVRDKASATSADQQESREWAAEAMRVAKKQHFKDDQVCMSVCMYIYIYIVLRETTFQRWPGMYVRTYVMICIVLEYWKVIEVQLMYAYTDTDTCLHMYVQAWYVQPIQVIEFYVCLEVEQEENKNAHRYAYHNTTCRAKTRTVRTWSPCIRRPARVILSPRTRSPPPSKILRVGWGQKRLRSSRCVYTRKICVCMFRLQGGALRYMIQQPCRNRYLQKVKTVQVGWAPRSSRRSSRIRRFLCVRVHDHVTTLHFRVHIL
jgi:hypothetical protein